MCASACQKVACHFFEFFPSLHCTTASPLCGRLLGQGKNFFEILRKSPHMSPICDLKWEGFGPPIPPIGFLMVWGAGCAPFFDDMCAIDCELILRHSTPFHPLS